MKNKLDNQALGQSLNWALTWIFIIGMPVLVIVGFILNFSDKFEYFVASIAFVMLGMFIVSYKLMKPKKIKNKVRLF